MRWLFSPLMGRVRLSADNTGAQQVVPPLGGKDFACLISIRGSMAW
jgi:hypothetical protein